MEAYSDQMMLIGILNFLAVVVFVIWMSVRVFHKAGRSGWWCLLLLVPILNIVTVWVFAFVRWPALEAAKAGAISPSPPDPIGSSAHGF